MVGPMKTAPNPIVELAEGCAHFVKQALEIELDYTPETLPILDHYLRERADKPRAEVLSLLTPAAGAYFGEVVRRNLGPSRWFDAAFEHTCYALEFENNFMTFNPLGMALEAIQDAPADGWGAHIQVLPEDQLHVKDALERVGQVSASDYHRLAIRFETLELVEQTVLNRAELRKETDRRFGAEVYAAARDADDPTRVQN